MNAPKLFLALAAACAVASPAAWSWPGFNNYNSGYGNGYNGNNSFGLGSTFSRFMPASYNQGYGGYNQGYGGGMMNNVMGNGMMGNNMMNNGMMGMCRHHHHHHRMWN